MRRANPGAEKWLGIETQVLDKGYVTLVDYMGSDTTIVEAARVSYGRAADAEDVAGNTRLINYLMKFDHGTPFEQCTLVFNVKAPIFVFREAHRHRTAKLNEISGRYAKLDDEFYVPTKERYRAAQSRANKQGSAGEISHYDAARWLNSYLDSANDSFDSYGRALDAGMAREVARIELPLSTYSRMRWQMDLRNLLNFLRLRTALGAQWEIRQFANAIAEVVKDAFPIAYSAWLEHVQGAVTLSASERRVLKAILFGQREMHLVEDGPLYDKI